MSCYVPEESEDLANGSDAGPSSDIPGPNTQINKGTLTLQSTAVHERRPNGGAQRLQQP